MMGRILLIDDDRNLREVAGFMLTSAGHEVLEAADGEAGLALLDQDPDIVVTDIRMPGLNGMEVLRRVREDQTGVRPVIVLTAHGTVEQAVEAMRAGAFTYLLKPFEREELLLTVGQALHTAELERDNRRLHDLLAGRQGKTGFVHGPGVMDDFLEQLRRAAPADAPVLITGRSGTGKELAARACHDLSPRWDRPFVAVNCGALPEALIESELFGHTRGAFTGANRASPGRIRAAAGGTLFLDEIAELPIELQPKLLRVLESHTVDPVGGGSGVEVDFRLVCATNRDLEQEVAAGRFREDLLFRIAVLLLYLPSLAERPGDIPLLWDHFTRLHGEPELESEPELLAALRQRAWRGNVRELKNLNQRLVLLHRGERLTREDLDRLAPATPPTDPEPGQRPAMGSNSGLPLGPLPEDGLSLIELEKEVIRRALERCGGNRSRTAAYLGIPRHVLVYRLEKYDIG